MSQQAPLQNRYSKTVRSRWTSIQLGDRRIVLLAQENELADNVIFQREESFIVAGQLLREGGGSGERFATIAGFAVVRLLLIARLFRRTSAVFVTFGISI